jgi:hypothetical protein
MLPEEAAYRQYNLYRDDTTNDLIIIYDTFRSKWAIHNTNTISSYQYEGILEE